MDTNAELQPESEQPSRRAFGSAVIYGLGTLMGLALAIPAALYLLVPKKSRQEEEGWVEAGDVSKLTPGVPKEMAFQQTRTDGWNTRSEKQTAWVVKTTGGSVLAFSPICTHLGCAYHWDKGKGDFVCPCHASEFSIDGKVLSGPAPRPLDRFEVKVENTRLWLGPVHQSDESKS